MSYPSQLTPYSSEPGVLAAAVSWVERLLMGSIATSIAVIALAWVGFAMLSGRFQLRAGARVVLGCFILFGAASIAQGLMEAVRAAGAGPVDVVIETPAAVPPPVVAPSRVDPYAGASVPM